MTPRVLLKLHLRLYTSRNHVPPLSRHPLWRVLQRALPFVFRRTRYENEDLRATLWALVDIPASEVATVVVRAKWIEGPDGYSYRLDGWSYQSSDNTYVAAIDYIQDRVETDDDTTALQKILENALEREYLRQGFVRRYPNIKATTYRSEAPCVSAS
jgi:hypothetical protein